MESGSIKPYPLQITQMDCSPLVIDNGYHEVQPDLLAQWVAQLLSGIFLNVARIIEGMDSKGCHKETQPLIVSSTN